MAKIRIGVVGLRFGQWHVRTLASMEDAHLAAVADREPHVPDVVNTSRRHHY
jgi:predicted dehydrogenase